MRMSQFQPYLDRDKACYATGLTGYTLVPQHRVNRGMGGSKVLDIPANIIVFDSVRNGLIESDPQWAEQARNYGWKLESWQDPLTSPVFEVMTATWWMLDNEFGRRVARWSEVEEWLA